MVFFFIQVIYIAAAAAAGIVILIAVIIIGFVCHQKRYFTIILQLYNVFNHFVTKYAFSSQVN